MGVSQHAQQPVTRFIGVMVSTSDSDVQIIPEILVRFLYEPLEREVLCYNLRHSSCEVTFWGVAKNFLPSLALRRRKARPTPTWYGGQLREVEPCVFVRPWIIINPFRLCSCLNSLRYKWLVAGISSTRSLYRRLAAVMGSQINLYYVLYSMYAVQVVVKWYHDLSLRLSLDVQSRPLYPLTLPIIFGPLKPSGNTQG